jgi:hypothetical protein
MTKRKPAKPPAIPPDATEKDLAFLQHRKQDLETVMAGTAMAAVNSGDFGRAHLAAIAHYLVNVAPDRIPAGQMNPYIRAILEMFVADNPRGGPRREAIDMVTQLWTNGNGMALSDAHNLAAMVTGKAPTSVKQDRYRARKRGRQRNNRETALLRARLGKCPY